MLHSNNLQMRVKMAALQFFMKKSEIRNKFQPMFSIINSNYSNFAKVLEYKKCYKILGISEDSDQEEIRKAYLKLVKKYHPDSGTSEADASKFAEIDKAFKILINKKSKERWGVEPTTEEQDIKHTAPQHRQYLSYEGIGSGTPFQRQKQYTKIRAMKAAENVLQHRISQVSAEEGALLDKTTTTTLKHKIKTKYGFDRLVEDLIQESMSRGEFNNLSGVGKPLSSHQNRNPYVDFVTHKLNEVLIDNGFTPEWIMLQKEIREDVEKLRSNLFNERAYLGSYPLSAEDEEHWGNTLIKYQESTEQINKKISKFNLVVPIMDKQMIQIDLNKEGQKALINGKHSQGGIQIQKKSEAQAPSVGETSSDPTLNVFGLVEFLFKK